jgi:hypothetical protein
MPEKSSNGRAEFAFPPMMMPFGFDALMEFYRPALTAAAQTNGKVYDGIAAMNKNWVAFVNRRLKEDLALPQQLAGCKSMQDMYGVYNDFFQTAYADYQSEFEQLGKLGKSIAEDTAQAVQSGAEEAVKNVAEKARTRAA